MYRQVPKIAHRIIIELKISSSLQIIYFFLPPPVYFSHDQPTKKNINNNCRLRVFFLFKRNLFEVVNFLTIFFFLKISQVYLYALMRLPFAKIKKKRKKRTKRLGIVNFPARYFFRATMQNRNKRKFDAQWGVFGSFFLYAKINEKKTSTKHILIHGRFESP